MRMEVDYECDAEPWRACRVCLDADSKLYHLFQNGLHMDFFSITGIQVTQDDDLPQFVCFVCCELLKQATAFRNKSNSTQRIFNILPAVQISSTRNIKTTPLKCLSTTVTQVTSLPRVFSMEETDPLQLEDHVHAEIDKSVTSETIGESENCIKKELVQLCSDDDIGTLQRDLKVRRRKLLLLAKKVKTKFLNNNESDNLKQLVHESHSDDNNECENLKPDDDTNKVHKVHKNGEVTSNDNIEVENDLQISSTRNIKTAPLKCLSTIATQVTSLPQVFSTEETDPLQLADHVHAEIDKSVTSETETNGESENSIKEEFVKLCSDDHIETLQRDLKVKKRKLLLVLKKVKTEFHNDKSENLKQLVHESHSDDNNECENLKPDDANNKVCQSVEVTSCDNIEVENDLQHLDDANNGVYQSGEVTTYDNIEVENDLQHSDDANNKVYQSGEVTSYNIEVESDLKISSTRNIKTTPLKCLSTTVTQVTSLPQIFSTEETDPLHLEYHVHAEIDKSETNDTIGESENCIKDFVQLCSDDDIETLQRDLKVRRRKLLLLAKKVNTKMFKNNKSKNLKELVQKSHSDDANNKVNQSYEVTSNDSTEVQKVNKNTKKHVDDSAKFDKSETDETIDESENSLKEELVKIHSHDDIETLQQVLKVKSRRLLRLLKKVNVKTTIRKEQQSKVNLEKDQVEASNDESYKLLLVKAKQYTNKNVLTKKRNAIESYRDSAHLVYESNSYDATVIDDEDPETQSIQIDGFLPQEIKINEEGEKFVATRNKDLNADQYDADKAIRCLVSNYLLSNEEQGRKKTKITRKNKNLSDTLNKPEPVFVIKEIESIIKKARNTKVQNTRKIVKARKLPELRSVFDMDTLSLKQYLINTNTVNVYAQMLHRYVIEKYIDKTREFNKTGDLEDECSCLSEFLDSEENATEIDQQETAEPSKRQLYNFIKEKYTTKNGVSRNQEPIKNVLKFNLKKNTMQTSIAELQKNFQVEYFSSVDEQKEQHLRSRAKLQRYINSEFTCEDCYIGFNSKTTFDDHMKMHDPMLSGEFVCDVCRLRFRRKYRLLRHQVSHKYKFVCKHCGKVFRNTKLAREHARAHSGVRYECRFCQRVFRRYQTRANHMRLHHGSVPCEICYELVIAAGVPVHHAVAHRETFTCQSCQKVFNDADALNTHARNSMGAACDQNLICCTICGDHFNSQNMLKMHVEEHKRIKNRMRNSRGKVKESRKTSNERVRVREKIFMCEMCGSLFTSEAEVRTHQTIHFDEKQFECDICSKRFRCKNNLTGHIRGHAGLRPFQCALCPLNFTLKSNLQRHQLVHTKERPFVCEICGNRFQQASNVKLHIATVHMGLRAPPRKRV